MYFIQIIISKIKNTKFMNVHVILFPFYLMFFFFKFNELSSQYYRINSLLSNHISDYNKEIKSNINYTLKKHYFLGIFENSFEGNISTNNSLILPENNKNFNETKLIFRLKKTPHNEYTFIFNIFLLKKGENNHFILISNTFHIPFSDNYLSQIIKHHNFSYSIYIPTTIISIKEYKFLKKINSYQTLGNLTFNITELNIDFFNIEGILYLNNTKIYFNLFSDDKSVFKQIFIFGKFLIGIGTIHLFIYLTILDLIKNKDLEAIKVKYLFI